MRMNEMMGRGAGAWGGVLDRKDGWVGRER